MVYFVVEGKVLYVSYWEGVAAFLVFIVFYFCIFYIVCFVCLKVLTLHRRLHENVRVSWFTAGLFWPDVYLLLSVKTPQQNTIHLVSVVLCTSYFVQLSAALSNWILKENAAALTRRLSWNSGTNWRSEYLVQVARALWGVDRGKCACDEPGAVKRILSEMGF